MNIIDYKLSSISLNGNEYSMVPVDLLSHTHFSREKNINVQSPFTPLRLPFLTYKNLIKEHSKISSEE